MEVASAAAALAMGPIDEVSPARHLILLSFLCDEALDSLLLHNVLQSASLPNQTLLPQSSDQQSLL